MIRVRVRLRVRVRVRVKVRSPCYFIRILTDWVQCAPRALGGGLGHAEVVRVEHPVNGRHHLAPVVHLIRVRGTGRR